MENEVYGLVRYALELGSSVCLVENRLAKCKGVEQNIVRETSTIHFGLPSLGKSPSCFAKWTLRL